MVAESFANFATTTLASPSPLTSGGTSFGVSAGTGALFPLNTSFYVVIDSEILLISGRSGIAGDTFNVGARGQDGTVAASHSVGATVQLSWLNANITHIWRNVADTYNPHVPYAQNSSIGTQGDTGTVGVDNEFEAASQAGWTFSSPSGSTLFNSSTSQPSRLLLKRAAGDNANYFAYENINLFFPGRFIATCQLSHAFNFVGASPTSTAHVELFVSDQTNPTAGPDTGNRVKVAHTLSPTLGAGGGSINGAAAAAAFLSDASGIPSTVGVPFSLAAGQPVFLRLSYDGSGTYTGYVSGDGITYWTLGTTSAGFTLQTIGLSFYLTSASGPIALVQTASVDFVRIIGTEAAYLPTFGNVS